MTGPLAGLRVVELAGLGPCPHAAMVLADLGADVVRVERPRGGLQTGAFGRDQTLRNRRSIAADLKTTDGVETVLRLAEQADILVEGFRPGVAEKLGVGPDVCLDRNPRLVYGRVTGWGQDGPLAQRAGHDINYLGLTGTLATLGPRGRAAGAPAQPGRRLRWRLDAAAGRGAGRARRAPAVRPRAGGRRGDGRRSRRCCRR